MTGGHPAMPWPVPAAEDSGAVCLRAVHQALANAARILEAEATHPEAELVRLVEQALGQLHGLHDEHARLRRLVLDLLNAFEAPEEEQAATERRARAELRNRSRPVLSPRSGCPECGPGRATRTVEMGHGAVRRWPGRTPAD
jgi:hypothetical protein